MPSYSEFVDRLLRSEGALEKLQPSDLLDRELARNLRSTENARLAGEKTIGNPAMFALVRGGLFYVLDAIEEAHRAFQEAPGDLGAYWHGMVHRREGDFDNARYWFRRAGPLPFFAELQRAASAHSATMSRQGNWDPYLFTGECEQARFGETAALPELVQLQKAEFATLFDYCWRQSALT